MRTTSYVSWEVTEVTEVVNARYDQLINTLVEDEVITQEQADIIGQYRCIVAEKNLFGKLWDKIFEKKEENTWVYVIEKLTRLK